LDVFEIRMDLRKRLDQQLPVVWRVKNAQESVPHAFAGLEEKVTDASLGGNIA
jgi:hypothetical protein